MYEAKHFCNVILETYPNQDPENLLLQEKEFIKKYISLETRKREDSPHFPLKYPDGAMSYQKEAYDAWKKNGKCGIFAMATGTGKTVTSLNCALHDFEDEGCYRILILVPSLDLIDQWIGEVKDFGFKKIISVSSLNPMWRKEMLDVMQKIQRKKNVNFVIISTYDSFVDRDFQGILPHISERMLLIADEAHNIGGNLVKACFRKVTIPKRIALSATPERIYDEEGSAEIGTFFNDSRPYIYSFPMSRAIREGRLCHYFYYPKVAYLNDNEMELYAYLSKKLALLWDSSKNEFTNKEEANRILIQRKRIIHKCENKINVYKNILREITEENLKYTFVYAPQGKYQKIGEKDSVNCVLDDEDDTSFIQKLLDVTKGIYPQKLCNTFTGKDKKEKREILLKSFEKGTINVLFAMKCLDEGVDIPRAERGIFTSSTGNPREFIQRRGRLLRKHKDKRYSYIYDIIVIPSTINREESFSKTEQNLVKAELKRVAYFASLAENCYANGGAYEQLNGVAQHFGILWGDLLKEVEQ